MDAETRKKVLRRLTYGLYILAAASGDEMAAATVTWLSQASFTPPLVVVAVKKGSHLHELVQRAGSFAVSIIAENQRDLAAAFFRGSKLENGLLNGYAFERGPVTGAPLLTDLPAWFEARITDTIDRGDHTVHVAEVVGVGLRNPEARPLALRDTEWSYGG